MSWSALPGWREDALEEAWPAFLASCATGRLAPSFEVPCARAATMQTPTRGEARAFFEAHFIPHRMANPDGTETGLVTGYYEPLLPGSRRPDERFRYPVYAPPEDLVTVELGELYPELRDRRVRGRLVGRRVVPYPTRAQIDSGEARIPSQPIAWVDDPIDLFFLHIQGSGRIRLPDGAELRVGYADQNGQPYRAVGRVLVERGELTVEQASMQGIRAWAQAHPDRAGALLAENPSYVFFVEQPATPGGPRGSLGVPLTAGRSIAVDRRNVPLGAPVFIATRDPDGRPIERLVLAQDTGGAIRGVVRADFFFGSGAQAGALAGRMRSQGRLWALLPREGT